MAFSIPGIRTLWARPKQRRSESARPDPKRRAKNARREGESDRPDRPPRTARTYAREAAALLLIASGIYAALALASFQADPMRAGVEGPNWVGPVGAAFAGTVVRLLGIAAWLLPIELVALSTPLLIDKRIELKLIRLSGDILIAIIAAGLIHIAFPGVTTFGKMPLGGGIGELFGEVLRGLFSTVGSFLIGVTVVTLILVQRSAFSFIELVQRLKARLTSMRATLGRFGQKIVGAWSRARELEQHARLEKERRSEPLIATMEQADAIIAAFADDGDGLDPQLPLPVAKGALVPETRIEIERGSIHEAETPSPLAVAMDPLAIASDVVTPSPMMPVSEAPTPQLPPEAERVASERLSETGPASDQSVGELLAEASGDEEPAAATPQRKRRTKKNEPRIVDTSEAARTSKSRKRRATAESSFQLPSTDLLDPAINAAGRVDDGKLKATAKLLEKTLADYKVEGRVQEIHPGPTVTMFEVSPAPGTKVSRVAGLADDLALGLSRKVRIIAPIPGKNRIGFEVPNERRLPVSLRELIDSREFMDMKKPLPCVFGRDIIGRPFFADLASMPHVIVAGATGAGKSVGLNVMLISLLYRRTPDELRLLMIDPKVVELAPFDRIPHLLLPVVTDMKQAANALKWAVDEMERRYQLFADAGTRNIVTYNGWVKRVRAGDAPMPPPPPTVAALRHDGSVTSIPNGGPDAEVEPPTKLPYIVIVIEEFADLMMQKGKEVEASVARLAQKARAAGLHVILATQRPSVDVITGMIKANFPTRIAFRVSQKVDSRTIIDQQGAEHLLGRGDMLVRMNGTNDVRRVQCPFVSEEEVQRVTDQLRAQGEPNYDESIVRARDEDEEAAEPGDAETDPLYDQAVRVVADTGKCSTSWVQRKLGVGYNRAAKIVETMEKNGIIGPANGSKAREIFISPR